MNKVLLDTDIFSEILKGKDQTVVAIAKEYLREYGVLTLSSATVLEVTKGLYRARSANSIAELLSVFDEHEVLPFTASEGRVAGHILALLESRGLPLGVMDPIIAATAIRNGLTVVTGNERHFERIRDLGFDLQIANWRKGRTE